MTEISSDKSAKKTRRRYNGSIGECNPEDFSNMNGDSEHTPKAKNPRQTPKRRSKRPSENDFSANITAENHNKAKSNYTVNKCFIPKQCFKIYKQAKD